MDDEEILSVCVLGMGYVGLTLSVVLAEQGYCVAGIENSPPVYDKLRQGKAHFFEENLQMRFGRALDSKQLQIHQAIPNYDFKVYVIAVATPVDEDTKKTDLNHVVRVLDEVGGVLKAGDLVCMRSTFPVGASRKFVLPKLEHKSGLRAGKDFMFAFAPERTMEGRALSELRENTQIIGGVSRMCVDAAAQFFHRLTPTIVTMSSMEAAEMVKIMDNTYRDVRFAYANELALVAEHIGIDVLEVIKAANIHYPRNNIPVPSPGVGGACLSKDPYILAELATDAGYIPELILKARQINEIMPTKIVSRIQTIMENEGKAFEEGVFYIAGFSFKGDPPTADLRGSTTVWLLDEIKRQGGHKIRGYDPLIEDDVLVGLGVEPMGYQDGIINADVLIIANNNREFLQWDIEDCRLRMNQPAIIYDAWRMLDSSTKLAGVTYIGPGL